MPPKRRRAPSSEDLSEGPCNSRRVCQASYSFLPTELRITIVELACLSSSPGGLLHDLTTCLNLSLVNQEMRAQVLPHLFRQISITRPSSLYSLEQLLHAHPERGALIKNLHIGSQDSLPADWWPITQAYPQEDNWWPIWGATAREMDGSFTWLATSLSINQLPSGFEPAWPLDAPKSGCRAAAIDDALQVAQSSLGFDIIKDIKDGEPFAIGSALEVQAVLDLYLLKVKEVEDADPKLAKLARPGARVPAPCRTGKCSHYPTLVITEIPPQQPSSSSTRPLRSRPPHVPPDAFALPRSELLRHISRKGAVADRFDHPLLIERSGFDVAIWPPPGRGHEGYCEDKCAARYEIPDDGWNQEGEHECDIWEELDALREADEQGLRRGEEQALNAPLINTATIASNLRLARSILQLSSALENLSLTGFLERAIGSGQKLPSLRRLTIGPPPLSWYLKLMFDGLGQRIEELRIGGITLIASEINAITTNFRKLKEVDWSIGHRCDESGEEYLRATIDWLVNATVPSPSEGQVSSPRKEDQDIDVAQPSTAGGRRVSPTPDGNKDPSSHIIGEEVDPLPLILVHLDKADIASVLASALSPAVQEAWLKGLPLPVVPRRLLLVQKDFEDEGGEASLRDNRSAFWDRMYQEGKEWWLRGAV